MLELTLEFPSYVFRSHKNIKSADRNFFTLHRKGICMNELIKKNKKKGGPWAKKPKARDQIN